MANDATWRAAVLGSPIAHSLSPALHGAAYAQLGLADWSYGRHEVVEAQLAQFVADLDGTWRGLSLTMPLKQAIVPLLDGQDELSALVGAVNTVTFDERGRWGHNTDIEGIVSAVREVASTSELPYAAILGAGGTARAAIAAAAQLGCEQVRLHARRAQQIEELRPICAALGLQLTVANLSAEALRSAAEAPLLISTLPVQAASHLDLAMMGADVPGILLDVLYHPWPTALAQQWQSAGGRCASGLAMLSHQAAAQVRLMTGLQPDEPTMRAAAQAQLAATS